MVSITRSLRVDDIASFAKDEAWEIHPYIAFGFAGFTSYLIWIFMLYVSPALSPDSLFDPNLKGFARISLVISLCLTLLVAWKWSDFFSNKTGTILLTGLSPLLNVIAILTIFIPGLPPAAIHGAWIIIGISQGAQILLWSRFLSTIGEHRILLFISLCVGVAAIAFLFMTFLQTTAAICVSFVFSLSSIMLFIYIQTKQSSATRYSYVKAHVSDQRSAIRWKSAAAVVIYCIGIGFTISYIAAQNETILGALLAAAAAIVASTIIALDSTIFHRVTESLMNKLYLPIMVVGIFPMFFIGPVGRTLCCAFMLCFFMVYYIINLSSISEHVRIYRLSAVRVFGYGRAGNALGIAIGSLAYYWAFSENNSQESSLTIVLLTILAIFIFSASFIMEDHYPSSKKLEMSTDGGEPSNAHFLPKNDFKAFSSYVAPGDPLQKDSHGIWHRKCLRLAEKSGLSPKETEVLFLLAKGRNAEYIQEKLVISRHTAKAHIYHIYQKTEVHSRQELINLLESIEIDRNKIP